MNTPDQTVADALHAHWVDRRLPQPLRPYARLMRLERPVGWWLLLLPGWWALALAGGNLKEFGLFLVGAIIMRGAGCTWNDITDRDIDAKVARTRSRPIPSGQVSVGQALVFLVGLLSMGLIILIQFNALTIALGIASLALIAVYPFMKRFIWWPQAFLGLTFNWAALMGWTAATGKMALPALLLYAGGIFWTLAYDTIYAHQDKEDDALIGVKSTALALGETSAHWIAAFFGLALAFFAAAGISAGAGAFFLGGLALAGVHAIWQLHGFNDRDPMRCLALFRSNRDFGLIIFAATILDKLT